jgi:hypothetical protein
VSSGRPDLHPCRARAAGIRREHGKGPTLVRDRRLRYARAGTGPYAEPVLGGAYGGYIGKAGNWAQWQGSGEQTASVMAQIRKVAAAAGATTEMARCAALR